METFKREACEAAIAHIAYNLKAPTITQVGILLYFAEKNHLEATGSPIFYGTIGALSNCTVLWSAVQLMRENQPQALFSVKHHCIYPVHTDGLTSVNSTPINAPFALHLTQMEKALSHYWDKSEQAAIQLSLKCFGHFPVWYIMQISRDEIWRKTRQHINKFVEHVPIALEDIKSYLA